MTREPNPGRSQLSAAHVRLGEALRNSRSSLGLTTRQIERVGAEDSYYQSGHISNVENGHTAPSPELIDAYIAAGADPLTLRSLYRQMREESSDRGRDRRRVNREVVALPAPPQDARAVTQHHEVQDHYFLESSRADCTFDERGVIREFELAVMIRARTDGVRLYYSGHAYSTDRRPGVMSVEAISGGTVTDVRESPTGALQAYFDLGRSLSPSDPRAHELVLRVLVDSEIVARPILVFHNTRGSIGDLDLTARFKPPMLPRSIWRFAVEDTIDAEHAHAGAYLSQTSAGIYSYSFRHLTPQWSYGFAWAW